MLNITINIDNKLIPSQDLQFDSNNSIEFEFNKKNKIEKYKLNSNLKISKLEISHNGSNLKRFLPEYKDIIIFKDSFIDTPDLQIPHPGALLRKFVLIPLAELASDEIFPKTNIKIVDLLEKCPDTSVVQKYIIDMKA